MRPPFVIESPLTPTWRSTSWDPHLSSCRYYTCYWTEIRSGDAANTVPLSRLCATADEQPCYSAQLVNWLPMRGEWAAMSEQAQT